VPDSALHPIKLPNIRYDTSWIGNTFGLSGTKWVQMDARAIYVSPDGTVYTNTFWEEGGKEAGIYKDGDTEGQLNDIHGWGRLGGSAVTANSKHIYVAMRQGDEFSPRRGFPTKGTAWFGVRRYKNDGTGSSAPFDLGDGHDGSMLIVQLLASGGTADVRGLAVDSNDRLYVSDDYHGQIRVYDANTMAPITSWSTDRPRQLAVGEDGTLWAIQGSNDATKSKIVRYSNKGFLLPQQIVDVAAPAALAVDKRGRLLVADNGPDQQIKIYGDLENEPKLVGTLGKRGGIFSGTPGKVETLKFNGLTGCGSDDAGNIYVSYNGLGPNSDPEVSGTGLVLQSYSPAQQLNWELLGLEFVDDADVDPASDGQDVYTKNEHFRMDLGKPSGQQWSYVGHTLNRFKYPDDPRLHFETHASAPFFRRIRGAPFLFVTTMYSHMLQIYRFSSTTDGEVAIPSGLFAKDQLNGNSWPAYQPAAGEWIWRDENGNGAFDPSEYDVRNPSQTPYLWGWWVDGDGNVWQANRDNKGIRCFPLQGLDEHGNPIYTYASMETIPPPAPFDELGGDLQRIEYDLERDVMYLAGYSRANRHPGDDRGFWGLVGKVVVRYDDWSQGNRTPRWQIVLPYSEDTMPKAMSIAEDKLFVAYLHTGEVRVYDVEIGAPQGIISPGPEVASASGWVDIPYGIRAYRRSDGEFLIFVEEDAYAKVMMYRWDGRTASD